MLYVTETSWKGLVASCIYLQYATRSVVCSIMVFLAEAETFDKYGQIFLVRSDRALGMFMLCRYSHSFREELQHCSACTEELLPVPVQSLAAGQPYPHKPTLFPK